MACTTPSFPFTATLIYTTATGNMETLGDAPKARGDDIRELMMQFYRTHYSANIMKLAVIGRGASRHFLPCSSFPPCVCGCTLSYFLSPRSLFSFVSTVFAFPL